MLERFAVICKTAKQSPLSLKSPYPFHQLSLDACEIALSLQDAYTGLSKDNQDQIQQIHAFSARTARKTSGQAARK
ncbi:MAG: hypothetical protein MUO76_15590 [Anaerolineaceae bacterium]|nr:hypothetical protein [Anaerolineaceae bacterium]